MGGGTFGNRTAVGEFNMWADPEAAAIVFAYGGPLVMAGLDVTHQFLATPDRIATRRCHRRDAGGDARRAAHVLLGLVPLGRHDDIAGAPMHDVLAVLALAEPELFARSRRHVAVETSWPRSPAA